jgi:hypothetical protein
VPASAEVVIVADVSRVTNAPLVERAIDQLFLRDSDLGTRLQKLRDSCKIDLAALKHVVLAIGPKAAGAQPGTGPVLLVATGGKLAETELATCVRGMVGQGGGSLIGKDVGGRTIYQAKDGSRTMVFAFSRADTVVMGSSEDWVVEALGSGKKALDNPDLKRWIDLADQRAPIWAAGRVDDRVRQGLVRVTSNQLSAGPVALTAAIDPSAGAKVEIGVVMTNAADAKTLESFAKTQKGLIAYAAQSRKLGPLVDKIEIAANGELVRFHLALTIDEINQLFSVLDGGGAPAQDTPPAPPTGSGSASGSGS